MPWTAMLKQSATVYRATVSQEPTGEDVRQWAVVPGSIGCLVQPAGGRWVQTDRGIEKIATWRLFCTAGADIKEADRVQVGTEMYAVTLVNHYTTTKLDHLEVYLERNATTQFPTVTAPFRHSAVIDMRRGRRL
jgi:hypothetical protein